MFLDQLPNSCLSFHCYGEKLQNTRTMMLTVTSNPKAPEMAIHPSQHKHIEKLALLDSTTSFYRKKHTLPPPPNP